MTLHVNVTRKLGRHVFRKREMLEGEDTHPIGDTIELIEAVVYTVIDMVSDRETQEADSIVVELESEGGSRASYAVDDINLGTARDAATKAASEICQNLSERTMEMFRDGRLTGPPNPGHARSAPSGPQYDSNRIGVLMAVHLDDDEDPEQCKVFLESEVGEIRDRHDLTDALHENIGERLREIEQYGKIHTIQFVLIGGRYGNTITGTVHVQGAVSEYLDPIVDRVDLRIAEVELDAFRQGLL